MIRASVVIPTRHRAQVLASCLESLTRQTLSKASFEVIVVDNGLRDSTPEVAARFRERLNITYVPAEQPGLHVGRHVGMRVAKSDILLFADDDIEAQRGWVEAVVRAFSDPEVALVGGNVLPKFEAEPPDWLRLWWNQPVYRGRALGYLSVLDFGSGRFPIDPRYVWGCNFCVRRQAVEQAGGFHPDGLPRELLRFRGDGETHVALTVARRGWRALFDSDASVYHLVSPSRMTVVYFKERAFAQGVSDSYTATRFYGRAKLPVSAALRTTLHPLVGSIRERWRAIGWPRAAGGRELLEARLGTIAAWHAGFSFHQKALREDEKLLGWVLQESYWP